MAPARGNSRDNRGRAVPAGGKGEDDGGWKGRGKNSKPGVTTDRATSFTRVLIPHLLQWTPVRTHFKIHWASVSLQGARAATHTHRGTPCPLSPQNPGRSPENTRARTPPGDVNKRRAQGAGRGSRDCSHRVTYVHAPPPPPARLPPGPAHRLPASPSEAPRGADVRGAPKGQDHARPRQDRERTLLALRPSP